MEYPQIRTILYQSEAIRRIPDRWTESPPCRCIIDGEAYVAFLYLNPVDAGMELKRMIAVHGGSGEVRVLEGAELKERYGLEKLVFSVPAIEDYDAYFHDRDEYEKLFAAGPVFREAGPEESGLLRKIVGEELQDQVFSRLM